MPVSSPSVVRPGHGAGDGTLPSRPVRRRRGRVVGRVVRPVTVLAVVGSLLVAGSPAGERAAPRGTAGTAVLVTGDAAAVSAVSAALGPRHHRHHPHRWRGHPGRRLVLYTVRRGDTVTGLAVRFHAWTAELVARNHLGAGARLLVGQRLHIPVVKRSLRPHHRHHHRAKKHHHRHHARRGWRHADASPAVVRRVVSRTAARHHVPTALALAMAWQESGWQQRRVSSAGALGVMQVMPSTGRWVSSFASRPLYLRHLRDNVTAGVLLLRRLRHDTRAPFAVAAYYQGLGSVRQEGLFHSTKRYLRSVQALRARLERGRPPA